jgi:ArsR family transcriptional regulator
MNTAHPDALFARLGNLADPTRLRLLRLLERHELGVAELCDVLRLPQSTVSRHLKLLADQGWLRSRSLRTTNLYRLADGELDPDAGQLWQLAREQSESWSVLQQDERRLAQRLEQRSTQEFFASAAEDWDRLRTDLYGHRFAMQAALALLPRDFVVVDLGCGTGAGLVELAAAVARVIGVDQSDAMLEAARRRIAGLDNVELRQGDLASPPVADASCDAAQLILALSYVEDPGAVLRSMARALKPGRGAVVVDLVAHDRDDFRRRMGQQVAGFEPGELARALERAGFVEARVRELEPEPGASGPALLLASAQRAAAP